MVREQASEVCVHAPIRIYKVAIYCQVFIYPQEHSPTLLMRPFETVARFRVINMANKCVLICTKSTAGTEEANWIGCKPYTRKGNIECLSSNSNKLHVKRFHNYNKIETGTNFRDVGSWEMMPTNFSLPSGEDNWHSLVRKSEMTVS